MSCWDEYLILGKGLAAQPFEGAERSSLSRVYYGAFNLSRRWLESNVTPIDNHRAHEQVWQTFSAADRATAANRKKWILIGSLGDSLRGLRNQADYADRVPGLEDLAPRAVAMAERIVQLLPELEVAD